MSLRNWHLRVSEEESIEVVYFAVKYIGKWKLQLAVEEQYQKKMWLRQWGEKQTGRKLG